MTLCIGRYTLHFLRLTWWKEHRCHSEMPQLRSRKSSACDVQCQSSHQRSGWSWSCNHWAPWAHSGETGCRFSFPPQLSLSKYSPRVCPTSMNEKDAPQKYWQSLTRQESGLIMLARVCLQMLAPVSNSNFLSEDVGHEEVFGPFFVQRPSKC